MVVCVPTLTVCCRLVSLKRCFCPVLYMSGSYLPGGDFTPVIPAPTSIMRFCIASWRAFFTSALAGVFMSPLHSGSVPPFFSTEASTCGLVARLVGNTTLSCHIVRSERPPPAQQTRIAQHQPPFRYANHTPPPQPRHFFPIQAPPTPPKVGFSLL